MEERDLELATVAAERLSVARRMITRIDGLGPATPTDLSAAHRIADMHAEQLGRAVVGWKVGCTSDEAMQILNSPGPFAGRVFEGTVHQSNLLDHRAMVDPIVECEFAFILGSDLPAVTRQYSLADVKAATQAVAPAIELVDSRFENWTEIGYLSLIADSAANGGAVIGPPVPVADCPSLASTEVSCEVDGEHVVTGSGSAILGDPWRALEWLANHLSARGIGLRAGEFVLSGTCTGIVPLVPGSTVRAIHSGLGEVHITRSAPH